MFKYTKRLISDIRFWCHEIKIRSRGNVEFERVILLRMVQDACFLPAMHPIYKAKG